MNGIHSIENDFQHWRETLTGTIDEYIKSSNNVELNEQFGALSTNLNMSDFEYSANNLAEIQKQINKLISEGGKSEQLTHDYNEYVKFINENIDQYNLYKQNLEEYTKSLNSTLQLIPSTLDFYDELSSGEKGIISSYINNFALDVSDNHKSFEDQIVEERSKIIASAKP